MINVTIGGVAYTSLNDAFQARQELTYKVDSCRLNVRSNAKPQTHAELIVTDGTNRMFAGVVVASSLIDNVNGVWEVTGYDYSKELDSKMVVEEYTGQTADAIFADIIIKYVDASFTSTGVTAGAPTIDFIQFNYVKVAEAFKRICDRVGWQWYVDYNKDIKFFRPEDVLVPAPEEITSINQISGLEFDVDVSDLRNRVYALGGKYLSDPYTYEIKSDGVSSAWVLPHVPFEITMAVNEVPKTIGVENVDPAASFDFLCKAKEKRVTLASGTKPADGLTIKWVYRYEIDIITVAENLASQAAIAAIQGTDGVYEDRVADETLVTIEAVEALAQSVINQYSDPYVNGSYISYTPGYEAGQMLKINLHTQGIVNTYMVQMVETRYRLGLWEYTVYFGGRLLSVADYLQTLVTNQQNAVTSNTEILQKYIYVDEVALLSDELTVTSIPDNVPYKVESSQSYNLNNSTVSFASIGSALVLDIMNIIGDAKYRIDAGTWIPVTSSVMYAEIAHPCTVEVSTSYILEVRNYKLPYDETSVVTGEVVVIG